MWHKRMKLQVVFTPLYISKSSANPLWWKTLLVFTVICLRVVLHVERQFERSTLSRGWNTILNPQYSASKAQYSVSILDRSSEVYSSSWLLLANHPVCRTQPGYMPRPRIISLLHYLEGTLLHYITGALLHYIEGAELYGCRKTRATPVIELTAPGLKHQLCRCKRSKRLSCTKEPKPLFDSKLLLDSDMQP